MKRSRLLLIGLWCALTATSIWANQVVWVRAEVSPPAETTTKLLSNALTMAALPGWMAVRLFTTRQTVFSTAGAAAASALGLGALVAGVGAVLRVRRALAPPRPRVVVSPGAGAGPVSLQAPTAPTLPAARGVSRRAWIANTGATMMLGGAPALGAYSTLCEPANLRLRRYELKIRGLTGLSGPLRILHLSDTHFGPRVPASFIEHAVAYGLRFKPHLVALTGDFIAFDTRYIDRAAELLRPLAAPSIGVWGCAGVLGNHDWYEDGPAMSLALKSRGVRMIDNSRCYVDRERMALTDEPTAGSALCLVGLGDLETDATNIGAAFTGVPENLPRILLTHQPDTAELPELSSPSAPRVDLMLCGHTHGGQVRVPGLGTPMIPSRFGQKYAGGLVKGPAFPVIVSRGVGVAVLPVRMGVPPEIGLITLFGEEHARF